MIDSRGKETTVNRPFINQHTIFLIVAGMSHDGHVNLRSRWDFTELNKIHDTGIDERPRRISQYIGCFVHALVVIHSIYTDGLFAHRALVRVARTLIVFGERNAGCQYSENGTRMNFAVSIADFYRRVFQIAVFAFHSNHRQILLIGVDVFYNRFIDTATGQQIVPCELF